ncbi:MAG: spore coat protein U domain-containing protein [Burkholderiaceae bacterium]|nr:spore coat protein U domain-containing protein [Burkholderiaceae bacterium]
MLNINSKALLRGLLVAGLVSGAGAAMAVGSVSSTVTVDATLVSACEVSPTAAIHFGNITNISSAGDKLADSGSSFQVACSSDVAPLISTTAVRTMLFGAVPLPFNLSLTAGAAADDFPPTATGLVMTKNGVLQTVTLYGRVLAANFTGENAKITGAYTVNLTVDVAY